MPVNCENKKLKVLNLTVLLPAHIEGTLPEDLACHINSVLADKPTAARFGSLKAALAGAFALGGGLAFVLKRRHLHCK